MSTTDEQHIQALVAQGTDEQVVRLIYALLALGQEQVEPRVDLLVQLGKRYLALALSREKGRFGANSEEALQRFRQGSLALASSTPRDCLALSWYREALDCLSAALNQAPTTSDTSLATAYRDLALALYQVPDRS
jgi:hypothetical protein